MRRRHLLEALGWLGGVGLAVLAIANAAGYRYGVSDQAFYIPSILRAADPELYPRDAELIDAQAQLMVSDEITAWLLTRTGLPLEPLLLTGHVVALGLLFAAVWFLARRLSASPWTVAACCLAATLRHRITETGANTFEGYYHPRGLAFAVGAWATVAVAGNRIGWAWALVALSTVLHPTTGLWWAIFLFGATIVVKRPAERLALVAAAVAVVAIIAAATPFAAGRLLVMDGAWLRPFAAKDYVFPTAWPIGAWLANLVLPAIVTGVWRWRVRRGLAERWEAAIVAGVLLLTATFLASLPFIAMNIALAVQLQTSRVFWLIDLFAVISMVWLLAEGTRRVDADAGPHASTGGAPPGAQPSRAWPGRRPMVVAALLLVASTSRGLYVTRVEHPERAFVQVDLEDSDWVRVGAWLAARTPKETHVLADPDHDWKYGHSVRVTAQRDVLVEGVKDAAVSLYDRDVATRVQSRLEAIGDFTDLDAPKAVALARRFDLDVLVIDRPLPLRELHRDGRFRVYELK